MLSKDEIITQLSNREDFTDFINEIVHTKSVIRLLNLMQHSTHKVAWRTAYLLDKVNDTEPEYIKPYLPRIIEIAQETQDQSVRRHCLRILTQHDFSQCISGGFIDFCFDLLHSDKVKVAVKVHAMQILFNLSCKYPDLRIELQSTLANLPPDISAGTKSRVKKLLEKLRKNKFIA